MVEWVEYAEYPCPRCGSIEYRDYGGGFNCREGHRNDALVEMFADEDEEFARSRATRTQLSTRLTSATSKKVQRKWNLRSGRGDHDINARYGITPERQAELFAEEKARFTRRGRVQAYTLLEAAMQVLLLQMQTLKNTMNWNSGQFEYFESVARKLFSAYASGIKFTYMHNDRDHPDLWAAEKPTKVVDDLDKELKLSDYDDFSGSEDEASSNGLFLPLSKDFRFLHGHKPFSNLLSTHNMTLITYLALLFSGVPVLLDELSRGLEYGTLPGYRPDFLISKDIVTARLTNRELSSFFTRHIPSAAELYANVDLMLRCLSKRCSVVDWSVQGADGLLERLFAELCIPPSLFGPCRRLVLPKLESLRFRMIGNVFADPCAQLAAGVVFFLKLIYGLRVEDIDEAFEAELAGEGLPTQDTLVKKWKEMLRKHSLRLNNPECCNDPLTDPVLFDELLEVANGFFYNRMVDEAKSAAQSIFGAATMKSINSMPIRRSALRKELQPASFKPSVREARVPVRNFKRYCKYPEDVNLDAVDEPYRVVLEVVEITCGVRGYDLHRLICRIFE